MQEEGTLPNGSERLERERQFHDERFSQAQDPRHGLNKWYAAVRHGVELQNDLVLQHSIGKDVLEYGCADGSLSLCELNLPQRCRSLTGIDISAVAITKASARFERTGLTNARFLVMDAEATTFADESFDLVFGRGILHHLDFTKCFPEIARVLRPGGFGIFSEPLGTNPIVNAIRNRTPDLRTADEHPFTMEDFEIARRSFAKVDIRFYGLFSAASALIDATAKGLPYRLGKAIDDVILRIPVVRRYAWHCLLLCQKSPFIAKKVP